MSFPLIKIFYKQQKNFFSLGPKVLRKYKKAFSSCYPVIFYINFIRYLNFMLINMLMLINFMVIVMLCWY